MGKFGGQATLFEVLTDEPAGTLASQTVADDVVPSGRVAVVDHARGTLGARLAEHEFAVLDVETTGLDPATSRIVEIAIVHVDASGRRSGVWHTLLNPEGPVQGTSIHGIGDADVVDAPRFVDVAGDIIAWIAGRIVVAHNADFDLRHLRSELARAGIRVPEIAALCTMRLTADLDLDVPNRRLETCLDRLGITNGAAHAALHDAAATACLLSTYMNLPVDVSPHGLSAWIGPSEPPPADAWPQISSAGLARGRPGISLDDVNRLPDVASYEVIFEVMAELALRPPALRCPECEARLVERTRRRDGKAFLGCLRFPDCRYARDT